MSDVLVIFARQPVAGRVKTRLAGGVGAERAAAIYSTLLTHTLEVGGEVEARTLLSLAEPPDDSWAAVLDVPLVIQGGGDIGQRMAECFEFRFAEGANRVVIIGSDNAHLMAEHIRAAFDALENHPVVLGPAEDGGYWLVGQRSPGVDLFTAVPWSSAETLVVTRSILQGLDIGWFELETLPDVDTKEDLRAALLDPRVPGGLQRNLRAKLGRM